MGQGSGEHGNALETLERDLTRVVVVKRQTRQLTMLNRRLPGELDFGSINKLLLDIVPWRDALEVLKTNLYVSCVVVVKDAERTAISQAESSNLQFCF
jgi:hypothetical protein